MEKQTKDAELGVVVGGAEGVETGAVHHLHGCGCLGFVVVIVVCQCC